MLPRDPRCVPFMFLIGTVRRQLPRTLLALATVLQIATMSSTVHAQTFTPLYTFQYGIDGGITTGGLIQDAAGNLYGVAEVGGDLSCKWGFTGFQGCGVVFKVTPSGQETVLYSFHGGTDGAGPAASLIRDSAGNFYGTTQAGGDPSCLYGKAGEGCGTVFKLDAGGTETVLYRFHFGNDGAAPKGALYRDRAGNLWGTAQFGGNSSCFPAGCGTIFRLSAAGKFRSHPLKQSSEGSWPMGNIIADPAGNIYGTTQFDGPNRGGTIFRLDPATGGVRVIHAFDISVDGSGPTGLLFSGGKLYGPTAAGGPLFGGTVWSLNRTGKTFFLTSMSHATLPRS